MFSPSFAQKYIWLKFFLVLFSKLNFYFILFRIHKLRHKIIRTKIGSSWRKESRNFFFKFLLILKCYGKNTTTSSIPTSTSHLISKSIVNKAKTCRSCVAAIIVDWHIIREKYPFHYFALVVSLAVAVLLLTLQKYGKQLTQKRIIRYPRLPKTLVLN